MKYINRKFTTRKQQIEQEYIDAFLGIIAIVAGGYVWIVLASFIN